MSIDFASLICRRARLACPAIVGLDCARCSHRNDNNNYANCRRYRLESRVLDLQIGEREKLSMFAYFTSGEQLAVCCDSETTTTMPLYTQTIRCNARHRDPLFTWIPNRDSQVTEYGLGVSKEKEINQFFDDSITISLLCRQQCLPVISANC